MRLNSNKKGITKEIIDEVLEDTGERDGVNDFDQAKKLVESRLRRLEGLSFHEKRQKLAAYLGRRGFTWETIKEAIRIYLKE